MSCPICFYDFSDINQIHILCYNKPHSLCIKCYESLKTKECPLCTTKINIICKIYSYQSNNILVITPTSHIADLTKIIFNNFFQKPTINSMRYEHNGKIIEIDTFNFNKLCDDSIYLHNSSLELISKKKFLDYSFTKSIIYSYLIFKHENLSMSSWKRYPRENKINIKNIYEFIEFNINILDGENEDFNVINLVDHTINLLIESGYIIYNENKEIQILN